MLLRRFPILLILLAALLGACSAVPYRERQQQRLAQYQRYAGEPIEKFHYFHLEDWEILGPQTLALRTSLRDSYLITVKPVCNQLEWANTIGVTASSNEVHRRFDAILVRGMACHITEIRPVRYQEMVRDERAEREKKG